MSHDAIALILWSMLALSLILTVAGVASRQSWILFTSATLSFLFGLAAIFSIGIFILAFALIQLGMGFAFRSRNASNGSY